MKIFLKKLKEKSVKLVTYLATLITYWFGVTLSFLLWKLSACFQKSKNSYWEVVEEEEDFESQY